MKRLQKVALLVGILTLTNTGVFGAEDASGMSGLGLPPQETTSPSSVELAGIKIEEQAASPTTATSPTALTSSASTVAPLNPNLWLRAKKNAPKWFGLAALVSAQISDAFIFDYLVTGKDRYPKEAYSIDAVMGLGAFTLATISAAKKIQTRMVKTGQSVTEIIKKEMKEHPEEIVMTACALLSQASGIGQIVDLATDSPATPDALYGTSATLATGLNAAALMSWLTNRARSKYRNYLWQKTISQEATSPSATTEQETKEMKAEAKDTPMMDAASPI